MKKRPQKKIGIQKSSSKQVAVLEPPAPPPAKRHFHYGVTQHFVIDIQEPDLDEEFESMTRMLQVIVSHPGIVKALCEYEALSAMEDTYVEECYGDMNYGIGDILVQFLDCFIEEDQAYIRQWQHDYDAFSILGNCFKSKSDGFEVNEYVPDHR